MTWAYSSFRCEQSFERAGSLQNDQSKYDSLPCPLNGEMKKQKNLRYNDFDDSDNVIISSLPILEKG